MDFDACITRLTGKNAKDAYAFTQQIVEESRTSDAWYPCFSSFTELLRHKNPLVRNRAIAILAANARWDGEGKFDALLEQANLSGYPDSMQPLVLKDIVASLRKLKRIP